MSENKINIDQKSSSRVLFKFPQFNYFGEILHDRLHAIFYYYEEWNSKFMLLTNLFDRDQDRLKERRLQTPLDVEELIYCGTKRARAILEKDPPLEYFKSLGLKKNNTQEIIKEWKNINFNNEIDFFKIKQKWQQERNANWDFLCDKIMDKTDPYLESFSYFDRFRKGELSFENVKVSPLNSYFKTPKGTFASKFQQNEYPIISDYFDVNKDKFIGIPLLGMGLFQGIVWIVFKDKETNQLTPRTVKRIVKYFQAEYDNLVLDWDVVGTHIREKSLIKRVISEVNPTNPIQQAIKLKKYYDISEYYHDERIKQSNEVIEQVKNQYRKTAIITTILDSYAHNISAHSLTTLSWWFRERADYLNPKKGENIKKHKRSLSRLGRGNNPLINHYEKGKKHNLAQELAPMFTFLLEKGAFWSGITRHTNFTGKNISLYSIFWNDFVNNPLYLGTIANTERVQILHINITFYKDEIPIKKRDFENKKVIASSKNGKLLSGPFAHINLRELNNNDEGSLFVHKGEHYELLSKALKETVAFFPGDVVGKHAFFTLIENEIRNVKHYDDPILKDIQDGGLQLNISIHRRPVDSTVKSASNNLLKIGVWLNHKVQLDKGLLIKRIHNLQEDILTKSTYKPKLGGNFQDKICASMLMTNTFENVQDDTSKLGKIYYPWIKTAAALISQNKTNGIVQEFEVSHRKYYTKDNKEGRAHDLVDVNGWGYLKKYFHLWAGDEIISTDEPLAPKENPLENYARYHFLHLGKQAKKHFNEYKSLGIIRILQGQMKPGNIVEAYQQWLPIWLEKESCPQNIIINFIEGYTPVARLIYTDGSIQFENQERIEAYNRQDRRKYKAIQYKKDFSYAHGSSITADSGKFNYRSHGQLFMKFGQGAPPKDIIKMPDELAYELLEILMSNICIFDRRVYNRMVNTNTDQTQSQIDRLEHYKSQLQLNIKDETPTEWKNLKNNGFFSYHFLVLHLSFIEHLKDNGGKKYSEERIIDFINEQILQGVAPASVPDNFILVITTGRGRMEWWDKIKEEENKEYARFTTFRPIESILRSVESALEMPDDFDLKNNLIKLLFGS